MLPPSDDELGGWSELPPGSGELAARGAQPADDRAAEEFYVRTFAEPSLDVHGIAGGSPDLVKTIIPAEARANVSIRLVPGQDPERIAAAFERLLGEAAPAGAELDVELKARSP